MKKFLGILAIAGVLVACNNSGESTTTTDSNTTTTDSNTMVTPPVDSTNHMTDSTNTADSTKK